MKQATVQVAAEDKSFAMKRFIFNAAVGVMFIVSASLFGLLGMIGVISIVGLPQGFALLICSCVLYACGFRLLLGALLDF